jgi:hypothetical protein
VDGWKVFFEELLDSLSDLPMLQLGLDTTPDGQVVDPAPNGPSHVEPGRRVQGQHLPGTLLGDTRLQQPLVEIIGPIKEVGNFGGQMGQLQLQGRICYDKAVLLVGVVLESEFRNHRLTKKIRRRVPLAELLKGERPVPEDLSSNVSGGGDLYAHAGHLKGRNMLMRHQVSDESVWTLSLLLALWVADPGTVDDLLLSLWGDPDELSCHS